jgi:L-seryl-tRNA(Ser) seleniumtransferase
MARSGAILREVGTTNRTHLNDYEEAIGSNTALLLKVHTSNYRVVGFTAEVTAEELVGLGRRYDLPVMNDLGSGCLLDLSSYGLEKEPTAQEAIQAGVDVVTFSGDKLLGGPQAGLILGKRELIEQIKANPLHRALRIDKLTLAALEATLIAYLSEEEAIRDVPTLRMLTIPLDVLRKRARHLQRLIKQETDKATVEMISAQSQVGGGALPLQEVPTWALAVRPLKGAAQDLEAALRDLEPPIVARIADDCLILDVRTIQRDELGIVAKGVAVALKKLST